MHVLRRYVDQVEGLSAFAAEAAANPVTQGVVLDINPVWRWFHALHRAGLRPELGMPSWESFLRLQSSLAAQFAILEPMQADEPDFKWVDPTGYVAMLSRQVRGGAIVSDSMLPFVVKVIAKPVGEEFFSAREELAAMAARQRFFAIVETRPMGMLAAAPGDGCTANGFPGTIGGFVRDLHNNRVFGLTCGHVAALGAWVSAGGKTVGQCVFSWMPTPLFAGQTCTRGCPGANRLDAALIDMTGEESPNAVTGIAAKIVSQQKITLRSAQTGVAAFEVGGAVLTYCPGNSQVCFENLFEVRPPAPSGLLNPRLKTAFATVPIQGDSGGWIETQSKEWCGMLVATDHLMGYALEAEDVVKEVNQAWGMNLAVA